jgi:hypothetical protein
MFLMGLAVIGYLAPAVAQSAGSLSLDALMAR